MQQAQHNNENMFVIVLHVITAVTGWEALGEEEVAWVIAAVIGWDTSREAEVARVRVRVDVVPAQQSSVRGFLNVRGNNTRDI